MQNYTNEEYISGKKRIEDDDWVLVYDSNEDNQQQSMRKFAKRWFGSYVVTSANDNATYHLAELDDTRIAMPIVGKRIKDFKKWHDAEPDLEIEEEENDYTKQQDEDRINNVLNQD